MIRYELQIKMQGDSRFCQVPNYLTNNNESNLLSDLIIEVALLSEKIENAKSFNKLYMSQVRILDNCDMKPTLIYKPLIVRC